MPAKPSTKPQLRREDKPSAFKYWINAEVVKKMGSEFKKAYPDFHDSEFIKTIPQLSSLELKQRVKLLADQLKLFLPSPFPQAAQILKRVIGQGELSGFELWPLSEYIGERGLENFEISLELLYELTQKFTAEFAIRPFLLKDPEFVLKKFKVYALHENVHIRRWVSEGTRPLLPWGQRLPQFLERPQLALPLLELLKFDEELYVRKSVANHLNDISKKHPELVVKILTDWKKSAPKMHQSKIEWLVSHSLRTLIKNGHPSALALMGADAKLDIRVSPLSLTKNDFKLHDKLEFSCKLTSTSKKVQKLIVDYMIVFPMANKQQSQKVFKLKTLTLLPGEKVLVKKSHSLKPITTRRYYPGTHKIRLQINGQIFAEKKWDFDPLETM